MQIKGGFSKGVFVSKTSSVVKTPSDCVDKRRKENAHLRASSVRRGQIINGQIHWADGTTEDYTR